MPRRRSSLPEPAAVGVSFQHGGKVYYFKPSGVTVQPGDHVLAKTERGVDIGEVVLLKHKLDRPPDDKPLKPLVRRATRDDLLREEILRRRARESLRICEGKIEEHSLPMKPISADYAFDGRRLTFFFSSDTRVDFRALVKDLADTFRCRIELRQIGVRDEAKMIGGLGPCGRPLCCAQWLRNFSPVGIRVAKDQGMSLNPAKISGVCDRLMCCLLYEHEAYTDLAERMPRVGDEVRGQGRTGRVIGVTLLRERVKVVFSDGEASDPFEVSAADLRRSKGYWRLIGTHPATPAPAVAAPDRSHGRGSARPSERSSERAPGRVSERPAARVSERPPARAYERPTETEEQTPDAIVVMREPRRRDPADPGSRSAPAPAPAALGEDAAAADRDAQERDAQKRSRKSRRRPRKRPEGQAQAEGGAQAPADVTPPEQPQKPADEQGRQSSRTSRRRPRRGRTPSLEQPSAPSGGEAPPSGEAAGAKQGDAARNSRRSRRRPRRSRDKAPDGAAGGKGDGGSGAAGEQ